MQARFTLGNDQPTLLKWVDYVVDNATIDQPRKEDLRKELSRLVEYGDHWRGNLSDVIVKQGFTNKQFNFLLFR